MATWTGTTSYATKKQLVSSISGLYTDLQDLSGFTFQNVAVSSLTAELFISTPILYVSSIVGANLDLSGVYIDGSGVFVTNNVSATTANFSFISISSLALKGASLDFDLSFDLGLGQALGGALGGLGAVVGGATIAVGTGVGLAVSGAEQGIATMVAGRPQNFISQTNYETINFTTQLQISTLGADFPLYSTIRREVSSVAMDQVPGREIFTSTFFLPGTTCIRSVSDPFNLITGDSNLNTSTIQSFGQWTPLPSVDETATFSTVTIVGSNLGTGQSPLTIKSIGTAFSSPQIAIDTTTDSVTQSYAIPINPLDISLSGINNSFYQGSLFPLNLDFVSTAYIQFQSTLTDTTPVYYLTSSISTPAEITYSNLTVGGNIAICEADETSFRSTGTFDFIATNAELFIQWGLAIDNLNSTIGAKTSKRVSWDIDLGYSNFIDIPTPLSTLVGTEANEFIITSKPNEIVFEAYRLSDTIPLAFNVNSATFGDSTTYKNKPSYPYQFNGNTFVNGVLEANTIIALSSIFATSTFVDTQVSTASIIADVAQITEMYAKEGYISTLKATSNWQNDYIYAKSRMRLEGYTTPLSIVVGQISNIYDPSVRFDFNTSQFGSSMYLTAQPTNTTIAQFSQSNVQISNLTVGNLVAGSLVYSNAEAPLITTSTIKFGWTGNFDYGGPVDFSLQQTLATPPGTVWNNYVVASNQVLNIMAFSNSVSMLAQQFSTPLQYINTQFDGTNVQGWTSTIFYNSLSTPTRVYLASNAGSGEVSFQGQTYGILVNPNQSQAEAGVGNIVTVPVGSTYKFTSDGTTWTTNCNAPSGGLLQYDNRFNISMDFENVHISTTDTLNINAETINLNGQVVIPNLQLNNMYLDGFLSTTNVIADSGLGLAATRTYTGSLNAAGNVFPLNLGYTVNSTDFLNIRQTLTPSRGFNLFNSYNLAEWNNTMFNIDTTPTAGRPVMIVGEVLQVVPSPLPYSGQFFINNKIDGVPLAIPIYVNQEGILSNLGFISGDTYARVYTTNGTNWTIQANIPNPQGTTSSTYNNFYQVAMNTEQTTVNSGMPMIYNMPSLVYNTNKTTFYSPMIRVATIDAQSFNTREAGMENVSYFDESIVFSGGPETWQSDAFNPIVNFTSNSYYSIAGWEAMISISRIRTDNDILLGYEVTPTPFPVGGGALDYIWGSARFIQVRTIGSPSASMIERYLMIPKNYFNFTWQGQGPIN